MKSTKGLFLTTLILSIFACDKPDIPDWPKDVNLDKGLLGYWPFSGNAKDLSSYKLHGVVSNAKLTTDRKGKENSAYLFDGEKNTNIKITPSDQLSLQNDFSISAWFITNSNITAVGQVQMIVSKIGDGVGVPNGYTFGLWGSLEKPMANFQANPFHDASTYPNGTSGLVELERWYNLTVTYDKASSTLNYYVNDILIDTKTLSFTLELTNNPLVIGEQLSSYEILRSFDGKIDDVRIYGRVLTRKEITVIYNK